MSRLGRAFPRRATIERGPSTFGSTIGTTGTSVATQYTNQKHEATLSTGRMVAWYRPTTTTSATFVYSDNGTTWTNYSVDILNDGTLGGVNNGSIGTFVDSNNIEHIVFIFTRFNSSSNNYQVSMISGSFNSNRSSITWGSEVVLYTSAGLGTSRVIDSIITAYGTGGLAMVVDSRSSEIATRASTVTITSADVVSETVAHGVISSSYTGANGLTWPSIDIDPVTKNVAATWTAPNATGGGMRWKRATFSAGTWTWQAEVEIDNSITRAADDTYWNICRWDVSSSEWIIGGFFTGFITKFLIYRRDAADTTTTLGFSAPSDNISGGSLAVDSIGNVYLIGRYAINFNLIRYFIWNRRLNTLTGPFDLDTPENISSEPYLYSWIDSGYLRMIYTAKNGTIVKFGQVNISTYQRPGSDITITGWTDQSGGTTNLWDTLNEVIIDDTDYVKAVTA